MGSRLPQLGPRLLLVLLLVLPRPGLSLDISLPEMGDPADALMTPTAEKRLGRAFINSLRDRERFIDEPVFEDYIESLGRKLVRSNEETGGRFSFHLIENPTVNAFAGPDGHIGVFTGLVLTTQSEDELASVLAHEIAHVTQKHLFRTFYRAQQMSTPAAVALLAAVLIGVASKSADFSKAAVTGVQAGMMQDQINYTRHNEEEADHIGMDTLSKAQFDPRAMPAFFDKLGKANQAYSTRPPEFLQTHPVTSNRIADAQGRAERYPYRQHGDSLRYLLLRAWLKARSFKQPAKAENTFKVNLEKGRYRNQEAEEYGYAIALTQKRDYGKAREILERLLRNRPGTVEYRIALAEVEQGAGNQQRALQVIDGGLTQDPTDKPLLLGKVRLLEDAGNYKQAASLLEGLCKRHPNDPRLFQRLSLAEGRIGKTGDAHAHMAEHDYLRGELKSSIHHLEAALRSPEVNDFQRAKLAARLRQVKLEAADELKEKNR